MLAAAAMTSLAGCVAESGDASNENVGDVSQAACDNPEGTNAMIAALATAVSSELHRWEVLTDFYEYRGYQNQLMLGLTSTGLAQCGGTGCPETQFLLSFQDSRMDQKITFGTNKLSSWSYASRLTTGYDNQKSCKINNQCPYEAHKFGAPAISVPAPGTTSCATLFTYPVGKPTGGNLVNVSNLNNALKWTYGNGPNPYIAFQPTANTVTIDPDGGMVGGDTSGTTSGAATCQPTAGVTYKGTMYNVCQATGVAGNDLTGQPCSYGSVCGTMYKAWPAYPNKYKCNANGC